MTIKPGPTVEFTCPEDSPMTLTPREAYNMGVTAALNLARACGDALAPAAAHRITRLGFGIEALDAFAEEGRALLIEDRAGLAASGAATAAPAEPRTAVMPATLVTVAGIAQRQVEARTRGYTGDLCRDCLNLTLVRSGTCLKCETCGSTSGCS